MKFLLKEKILLIFFSISFGLLLVSAGLIYLNLDNLSSPLILHFSVYEGVDLVGDKIDLWKIPIMGFLVFTLNLVLGAVFFYRERIITYVFLATGVFVSILVLINTAQIITLN